MFSTKKAINLQKFLKVYIYSILYNYYTALTSFFLAVLSFNRTQSGEAINIEEYAPTAIPTSNGNENSLTVGTNTLTAAITNNVVNVVLIDLANV